MMGEKSVYRKVFYVLAAIVVALAASLLWGGEQAHAASKPERPPSIAFSPESGSVEYDPTGSGTEVTAKLVGSDRTTELTPATYKWYKDDELLWETRSVTLNDPGTYKVVGTHDGNNYEAEYVVKPADISSGYTSSISKIAVYKEEFFNKTFVKDNLLLFKSGSSEPLNDFTFEVESVGENTNAGTGSGTYTIVGSGKYTGELSGKFDILGRVLYVKQNADGSWPINQYGSETQHEVRAGSPEYFTIDKSYDHYTVSGWSSTYEKNENNRNQAYPGQRLDLTSGVNMLYLYYSLDQSTLTFYEDLAGEKIWKTEKVRYGTSLESYEPTPPADNGVGSSAATWSGEYQLSALNNEMYTFGGWATEPGITTWMDKDGNTPEKAVDWTQQVTEDVKLYPIWVQNYVNVRLDLGAWDQVAVDNADGRSDWYDKSKYDQNTPASMPDDENASDPEKSYQKRSFNKSTVVTAATPDHDKYLEMERMNGATRTGYTLVGWYTASGVKWASTNLISREYGDKNADGSLKLDYYKDYRNFGYPLTLTARWTLNEATITYNAGGGSGAPTDDGNYKVGDTIEIKRSPEPPGQSGSNRYEFKGWKDKAGRLHHPGDKVVYADEAMVTAYGETTNTIKLTAEYQEIPANSLVFDSRGGSPIDPITGDVGHTVSKDEIDGKKPERVGYGFIGWYTDSECETPVPDEGIKIGSTATTVYAGWKAREYTLTFDSNGGSEVNPITQNCDTPVTRPADPTREGYTFAGWDKVVPSKMPAENVTFKALWKVNQHTVTYKYNDNTTVDKVENLNYGESVVEPTAPTWEGHTFIRWEYEDGSSVSFPFAMPDQNVTIKAIWKQNQAAPAAPAATPADTTVKVNEPGDDEEYLLVAKGQAPAAGDWANAIRLGDGLTEIVFGGLTPNTAYDLYARMFETDEKMPSPASKGEVTTLKSAQGKPAAPSARAASPTTVVVDPTVGGAEYIIVPKGGAIPEGGTWKAPGEDGRVVFDGLSLNTGYDVYARMKETDRQYASDPAKAEATTPKYDSVVTVAPTSAEGLTYDGKSHDLLEQGGSAEGGTLKYSLDGADWQDDVPSGTDAGTYRVWYKVVGDADHNDSEPECVSVQMAEAPIADAKVTLEQTSFTYDGKAKEPAVKSVVLGGKTLKAGADYAVSYKDNVKVGTATVTVAGKGNYAGSATATFAIKAAPAPAAKISIAKAKVTLAKKSCAYDGKAKEPAVKSVVLNGKKLRAGTDYAVKYKNNKKLGTATATVTGRGDYEDSAKATFAIELAKAKLSTAGHVPKSSVTASWNKVAGAKSYQLQHRKAGGKWKTQSVKGTSADVTKLKPGKLYQFRVRAVAGKRVGAWSNVPNRWLQKVKGVKAASRKTGTVTAAWKADARATAGYTVVVRYERGGAVAAKASVAAGETSATVKGLKPGKGLWVQVRPLCKSGGKTYTGVLRGTWAKEKSAKSLKAQSAQGGGLTAASI